MGLNQSELARMCEYSPRKTNEIVKGKRGVSASFAIVLEVTLGITAKMWVRMQAECDLFDARKSAA